MESRWGSERLAEQRKEKGQSQGFCSLGLSVLVTLSRHMQ